jgi:hypothetical protein
MTKEQLRMQMLAGIITESQYKEKLQSILKEWGGGDGRGDRMDSEYRRRYDDAQSMTPKDKWKGNEDGYIQYLLGLSSVRWKDVDGEQDLVDISGIEYADDHFADLDDKKSYEYRHAKGRGYLDWELKVRDRYNELKKSGEIKKMI